MSIAKFTIKFTAAVSAVFIKLVTSSVLCCGILATEIMSTEAAVADDGFSIIRDAETETVLTEIVQKIFDVAKLRKKSAKVYVVNSQSINAFTIGGGYVFITSGLLLKLKNPLHLIAVICHETAHISAGHINNMIGKMQNLNSNFLLAALAGIVGAIATGSPEAMAVLLGYQMTAGQIFLRFSRDQELGADALGASYMIQLGYDPHAMIEVFELFERLEIMGGSVGIPNYVTTHPKSIDRISALKKHFPKLIGNPKNQAKLLTKADSELQEKYTRITEKLRAYLGNGNALFPIIPKDDYPKAIYLHKNGKTKQAVDIMKKLVQNNPKDFYYKETLAQILSDSGHHAEAIKYYKQIYNEKIHPLIKIEYAKTLVQENKPDYTDLAIKILEKTKYKDPLNPEIFRLLATAYGQKQLKGISFFMLAQESMLMRDYEKALNLFRSSIKKLNRKTEVSYIKKAKYFIELVKREMKEQN